MEVEVNRKKLIIHPEFGTGASRLGIAFLDDEHSSQSLSSIDDKYIILSVISYLLGLLSIVYCLGFPCIVEVPSTVSVQI